MSFIFARCDTRAFICNTLGEMFRFKAQPDYTFHALQLVKKYLVSSAWSLSPGPCCRNKICFPGSKIVPPTNSETFLLWKQCFMVCPHVFKCFQHEKHCFP